MSLQRTVKAPRGWVCLDIDGTITHQMYSIPQEVTDYLKKIYLQGWNIVFVTGRMFSLGIKPLEKLDFPFFFSPQNGASWFEMPQAKQMGKKYLSLSTLMQLLDLLQGSDLDFVLISGYEHHDQCFYRPHLHKDQTREYFENTLSKIAGHWNPVKDFKNLPIDEFPYAKLYGSKEELQSIYEAFERVSAIKSHLIKDSAHPNQYTLHVMRADVDKGKAVLEIMKNQVLNVPIISAGNDFNDETLLDIADIKIAMPNSPPSLIQRATLVASPVEELGIIQALKWAINEVEAL